MKTRYLVMAIVPCMAFFAACPDPDGAQGSNANGNGNTFVKFENLEQYSVTVYSDSQRNQAIAEVAALGSQTVAATANSVGAAFYPTFHLDLFNLPGISIPYNGPALIAVVEANKTNNAPIPKLESIETNSAHIKISNNSSVPLTLLQGNVGRPPIGGGSNVVSAGQRAVFEVNPGPSSAYSVMHNTDTPVAFPADLTGFKRGMIYSFTYNGTSLTLDSISSVLQTIAPAVPENVRVESVSSTSVQITWDEVYGATSYQVYRATGSETGTYTRVTNAAITALSYTDTGLSAGQTYYYKVSAVNSRGNESAQSAAASSIMAPGNLRVTAVAANSVSLAWYIFSGASGYNIYRSTSETGTYSKVNTTAITATEFTDTNVSANTEYWYKVSAIVGGVESLQSGAVLGTTPLPAPGNIKATAETDTSISLAWNAVTGASGYNVYRAASENGTYLKVNSSILSVTSCSDTGRTANTTYYYRVCAVTVLLMLNLPFFRQAYKVIRHRYFWRASIPVF